MKLITWNTYIPPSLHSSTRTTKQLPITQTPLAFSRFNLSILWLSSTNQHGKLLSLRHDWQDQHLCKLFWRMKPCHYLCMMAPWYLVRQSYCRSCCRAGDLQPVMLLKPSGKYSLSSTQINYMHSPYTKPLKVYIHSVAGKMLPRKAVTALQYPEKPVLLLLPHVPLVNVILRCSDRMLWHTQKTDW